MQMTGDVKSRPPIVDAVDGSVVTLTVTQNASSEDYLAFGRPFERLGTQLLPNKVSIPTVHSESACSPSPNLDSHSKLRSTPMNLPHQ